MKNPCKNCADRKPPDCHSVCLYYRKYRDEMDAAMEKRLDEWRANDTERLAKRRMMRIRRHK